MMFVALYCVAAFAALVAGVYLLWRRGNAFMQEEGTDSAKTIETPTKELVHVGYDLRMRSSPRLRRWTAAFMTAVVASHVWWYAVGQWWLTDDWLVRTILVIMLDYAVLVPLAIGVLLAMLQDHRRAWWPWLVAQVPVVVFAVVGISRRDMFFGYELGNYWQLAVCAAFIVYYIRALRQYGRWLRDNFAALEHKEVWQSMVFAVCLFAVYVVYTSNAGEMMREYLSQVVTLVIVAFLVWRVETLQELPSEEDMDNGSLRSKSDKIK